VGDGRGRDEKASETKLQNKSGQSSRLRPEEEFSWGKGETSQDSLIKVVERETTRGTRGGGKGGGTST